MRSGKEDVEEALSRRGRFKTVNSKVEIKEVIIGDGEARKRYVLVKNPAQEERDRKTREKHIQRI